MTGIRRLVGTGSVVVDLVLYVDHLPQPGSDVLATRSVTVPGGGIHALGAAARAGLPVAYAGAHGTGPFGDAVRTALARVGAQVLLAPSPREDTGFCVVLVEPSGERTFATTVGAEGHLTRDQLHLVRPEPADAVYVSGYDLAYPHAEVIASWVSRLPEQQTVVLDPGPLVLDVDDALLGVVYGRTTWLSLNAREAALCTGGAGPAAAAQLLLDRGRRLSGVVVRTGADGAVLAMPGTEPAAVPGVRVTEVVDTTGAGDAHVGTFVAALARGADPRDAVAAANAAAARWVSAPATGR